MPAGKNPIMLLIFDCDGVILDSMPLHHEVEQAAFMRAGITKSVDELAERFSGVPLLEIFEILESETGITISPDIVTEIDTEKRHLFAERLKIIPGFVEALDRLSTYPRCIASGCYAGILKSMLDAVNLTDTFVPHIFSSDMVTKGKPAPDLFLLAARTMGFAPEDCLVIEDGIPGVQAALAAGMRAIGFTGGSHCDAMQGERLKAAGAIEVFSDMAELPKLVSALEKERPSVRRSRPSI
jgi:HAD superfamily hydrolase (TIGR01509 family)